ncbi:peptidase M50 [Mycolicibacterium baixiangningiae]|uniref:peptidase M50 n=1 Tax=Mycolicibacterium baixiangningiae TaxID=2761578 RepID=UPI001865A429|nr:peptidase M50 [Mycolicibacterium baixiangningiae]
MSASDRAAGVVVLRFGEHRVPRGLTGLDTVDVAGSADVDAAAAGARRLVVVGADADLATVLTRLMRTERLGVELAAARGFFPRSAVTGEARRVPLIRDDAGIAIVGSAQWRGFEQGLFGEAVVDDTTLFTGDVAGVRIEPTAEMPGLRAAVQSGRGRPQRWVAGRAAQLGTTGARVIRDGVEGPREVKRSTFYRHTEGWLRVG